MGSTPSTQGPLARLLEHRGLLLSTLLVYTGVRETELRAVATGQPATPALVRLLAPALGLHTADLFVIAELPVPDDLTPLDPAAGSWVPALVAASTQLPPTERGRLHHAVRSLPQTERSRSFPPPPPRERYPPGPGGLILRLLRNRNLGWSATARCLARVTPHYYAAATIGRIGHGRKEMSPDLVACFAALLGLPADDLAALTGHEPADPPPDHPDARDAAALIWHARRLTAEQLRHVLNEADEPPAEG
ncbi:XRE family transcriptional regulator [Micromonospora yangpuensis]|uniref:Uncharacterized protein n=1 Tax=Micromonospora yangpuensis TaxID=683228 RepID=A0A1C6U278_9ACTN|nr:XRE family transcriptional regulator [Micromonospora yangpuensis]GGM10340.1 hypothetical protein GCM10012279_30460 [Micromonospora yangpuensis]SCL48170.1 hypothetical protein GA0070617_0797 [Micromonospora yangpuensis]